MKTWSWLIASFFVISACTTNDSMSDTDLVAQLSRPYKPSPYIPEGLERVVVDEQGIRWQVVERRVFAQVGDSVDLWIQRAEPGSPFGEAKFTGLVPSCYGRARNLVNQRSGELEGTCYLRRFFVMGDEVLFQLRLGGDWVTAMSVQKNSIYNDSDGDGWSDATEQLFGTQIDSNDSDGDSIVDPKDPNPLLHEDQRPQVSSNRDAYLVNIALKQTKACQKGKPLFISGPDRFRAAYTGLHCFVLWRSFNALNAAERTQESRAQDTEAINSRGDKTTIDVVAREGGIARVLVDVDNSNREKPVVIIGHLLGRERVVFLPGEQDWVPIARHFEFLGEAKEESSFEPLPPSASSKP